MIWVWIIAAVLLSVILCNGYNIRWHHYIWLLLPIECYGIPLVGATIKPYMIFGLLITISNIMQHKHFYLPRTPFLIIMLIFISDCFTGLILASIMQHVMFFVVMFIAYQYLIACDNELQLEEIEIVLIATLIGYGVIFACSQICFSLMPNAPGLFTTDRLSTGMFLRFLETGGTFDIRFRGFCIDPNAVISTLIPGAVVAFSYLLRSEKIVTNLFAVLLYCNVVVMSGSRMALLCSIGCALVLLFIKYRQAANRAKWIVWIITCGILVCIQSLICEYGLWDYFFSKIENIYSARAGITDKDGRFTIWIYNLSTLFDNRSFIWGVGQNQISQITLLGKACHNTWLEWICGTGIFIGSFISIWFITTPLAFSHKLQEIQKSGETSIMKIPLILSFTTVLLCITTIDNITNSILIIMSFLLRYANCQEEIK